MTLALLVSVSYCIYLFVHQKDQSSSSLEDFKNPFDLIPAITFGLLYAVILLLAHWAQIYFGNAGVYVSGVVSGLVDVDAITVSMSKLSSQGAGLEPATASRAIVFAAASNTLTKGCIVHLYGICIAAQDNTSKYDPHPRNSNRGSDAHLIPWVQSVSN